MPYSLTFGNSKNTWADWNLIPSSPPIVPTPEPQINFVPIPGRKAGAIDMSKYPFGRLTYQRMSGSWEFFRLVKNPAERIEVYESIRSWLHGRTTTVQLEEDPNHYFQGMFTVGSPSLGQNSVSISIGFNLEPIRYNSDGTEDTTYLSYFPE